jgi:hypothetical protein
MNEGMNQQKTRLRKIRENYGKPRKIKENCEKLRRNENKNNGV